MGQSKHKRNRDCKQCGRSYNMNAKEFADHRAMHDKADKKRGRFTEKNEIKLRGFRRPNSPLTDDMAKILGMKR